MAAAHGSRDFVLEDDASRSSDAVQAMAGAPSLDGRLAWADGSPDRVRVRSRTWLDTFDWRLYRAGLTLEQVTGRDRAELVLTGRDGDVLAVERLPADGKPHWPSLVSSVPAGPLRELMEPVAGVRALSPVARATSRVTELRALNDDAKTVARLAIDRMSVTHPARASAPARLTLTPVRGYSGVADRIGRAMASAPGIRPGRASVLDAALAAAGHRAGDLPGKASSVRLGPSMPAASGMAAILTALLDALEANVPGTVKDVDTEFLHDLRIAVRWTRSALKLCGSALPDGLALAYGPEFRWLGDLTTPTRDLDVYLLDFASMATGLIGATESELTPFRDHLVRSRALEYRRLARSLRSARFARLPTGWRTALADVRIRAAQRKALQAGRLITAASPSERLHDLRKRCKELRYLVEMFGSLHDPAQHRQAVRELKALQNCLGEFQDAEVQRTEIRAFAAQMLADRSAPAATLLAMGEIAAGLARRQRAARGQFDSRFADFASPASQARLTELARTAAA